jgi:hypothetical protein
MHIDWGVVAYIAFGILLMGGLVYWFCFIREE